MGQWQAAPGDAGVSWGRRGGRLSSASHSWGEESTDSFPEPTAWELAASTTGQPIVFDANGSLRPSLLGYHDEKETTTSTLITWFNTGSGFTSYALEH